MFGRKRDNIGPDRVIMELQRSGVYTMGHGPYLYVVGDETVEAVKAKKIYSFWSGVWYTTILSILLFWFPPFGQMIAGYVGGRKAGTPRMGALAALAPMSIIFLMFFLRYMGNFVAEIDWFLGLPTAGAHIVSSKLPILGPLFGFMFDYIQTFISAMWSGKFIIYPYALTVIFGYVGGILSLQHRKEMDADGTGHPFHPVTIINQQPGGSEFVPVSASQAEPHEPSEPEIVRGKIPKGWKMKKDKKKGKWK